jgi:hypothetical protein
VLLCLTASIMMILMIMMMDERKNQYLYKPWLWTLPCLHPHSHFHRRPHQ